MNQDFDMETIMDAVERVIGAPSPRQQLSLANDWSPYVPEGAVSYLNEFRELYFHYDAEVEIIDTQFRQGNVKRVADLGCGVAPHLIRLAKLGYNCTGVDTSQETLELAKKAAKKAGVQVEFILGDMTSVEFDERFDAIVTFYVPMSFPHYRKMLRNTVRLLRPGGYLVYDILVSENTAPGDDIMFDMDVVQREEYRVTRLERWWKQGPIVSFNVLHIVRKPGMPSPYGNQSLETFMDHNDMYLRSEHNEGEHREVIQESGFEIQQVVPVPGSMGIVPWASQSLEFLRKV